jgi:hypothetical protein
LGEKKKNMLLTTEDTATAPNPTHSACEAVAPVCGHGCLDHLQRLKMNVSKLNSHRIIIKRDVHTCPNEVTSNKFNPAPSKRLLNLTGFFSSLGAEAADGVAVDILG